MIQQNKIDCRYYESIWKHNPDTRALERLPPPPPLSISKISQVPSISQISKVPQSEKRKKKEKKTKLHLQITLKGSYLI